MNETGSVAGNTQTVTPHIVVRDASSASQWYQRALGAEEVDRVALPDGKLMSVELRFGDSTMMVADEFPEFGIVSPLSIGGTAVVLHMVVKDVDDVWERAVQAGAEVVQPLQDQFWGDRHGQLLDPSGHKWGLAQHIRDVPKEEIARAAAERFAGG